MFMSLIPGKRERALRPVAADADPFLSLHREMTRLFDDVFGGAGLGVSGAQPALAPAGFSPRVDVHDTDEALVLTAELPGLSEKDFELSIEDDVLTLKGEKREEQEAGEAGRRHRECRYGRFERRLVLPEVDADAIQATFKDGVLSVTLPKLPEARPEVRRVEVRSA